MDLPPTLFVSLKLKEFSVPVGNLVKCRTESELETLKALYEGEFRSVTDQKRHGLLFRTFKKVGLTYADGTILIAKSDAGMSSLCGNANAEYDKLNRSHTWAFERGYLKKNPFWASLGILYNAIVYKTLHFDLALAHDFRGALKRCRRRSQFLS
jgi:hypothetical protein